MRQLPEVAVCGRAFVGMGADRKVEVEQRTIDGDRPWSASVGALQEVSLSTSPEHPRLLRPR